MYHRTWNTDRGVWGPGDNFATPLWPSHIIRSMSEYGVRSAQEIFAGFKLPEPEKGAPQFPYEHYVKEAAGITNSKYMVMHSRLARAFKGKDADHIIFYVSKWLHEAEKSNNPGLVFNARFKQYREALCAT